MKRTTRYIIGAVIVVAIILGAAWYFYSRNTAAPFCFDFVHDMQFGDRQVAHPYNQGFGGPGGIMYYVPEVPALQVALEREGFYIDPYESTGGKVYSAAFFGPSTRAAVMSFQHKYGLPETGQVTNDTLDKLAALYDCPRVASTTATTTTAASATSTK